MRFLVFSDTHGVREPMRELYQRYPNDGVIHLGDYNQDACWMMAHTFGHPVYQVVGNCDFTAKGLDKQVLEFDGVKLMLVHGHRYGVKSGYGSLLASAKAEGVDAVLFGHTHVPFMEKREGILMLNPGSLRNPDREYAIIEIENGTVKGVLLQYHE